MKASLKLEAIGDDLSAASRIVAGKYRAAGFVEAGRMFGVPGRCWCAEIVGTDPRYGFRREFLQGRKDYTHANGAGSRGVFVYYMLESGSLYEVRSPISWSRSDRYFCTVSDAGDIVRLGEEEARAWLRRRSSDPSA